MEYYVLPVFYLFLYFVLFGYAQLIFQWNIYYVLPMFLSFPVF